LVVQLSNRRIQMFKHGFGGEQLLFVGRTAVVRAHWGIQSFVVSSCLLSGRSGVRWADLEIQTVFCGEQLPFGWSVSIPIMGLGRSDNVLC
jgi:hypothetical protein